MRRAITLLTLILACSAAAAAPNADEIIRAVKSRMDRVNDYRAEVSVTARGKGISINGARATVYYKKPGKLHVEPKDGLALMPATTYFGDFLSELAAQGDPKYVRSEKLNGRQCHVIRVTPARAARDATLVWVDSERDLVLATQSGDARSSWRYAAVDGKHYLPAQVDAWLPSPGDSTGKQQTRVTLKFSGYRVNKGIPDSVFQRKPGSSKK